MCDIDSGRSGRHCRRSACGRSLSYAIGMDTRVSHGRDRQRATRSGLSQFSRTDAHALRASIHPSSPPIQCRPDLPASGGVIETYLILPPNEHYLLVVLNFCEDPCVSWTPVILADLHFFSDELNFIDCL